MKEDYRFHEGCDYQLAIHQIQQRFGVLPDRVCPTCSNRHLNAPGMSSGRETLPSKKRASRRS
jgi:hypothetical protein